MVIRSFAALKKLAGACSGGLQAGIFVFSASVCVAPALFRPAPGGTGTVQCPFAIAVIPRAASAKGFLWRSNKVTRGICFSLFRVPHTSFLRVGLVPVCVAAAFRCGFGTPVESTGLPKPEPACFERAAVRARRTSWLPAVVGCQKAALRAKVSAANVMMIRSFAALAKSVRSFRASTKITALLAAGEASTALWGCRALKGRGHHGAFSA